MKRIANKVAYHFAYNKIDFQGSNLQGKREGNKYIIRSYGWYPLFLWMDGRWFENAEKYSISTSKQTSQCRPTKGTNEDTIMVDYEAMKRLLAMVEVSA